MLCLGFINMKKGINIETFTNEKLEIGLNIRNAGIFWCYLSLFICYLLKETYLNGYIIFFVIGIFSTILISIIYFYDNSTIYSINNKTFSSEKELLKKINFVKSLIDSHIEYSKGAKNLTKSSKIIRSETYLKGFILIHEETCVKENCPLKKFLNNPDDFNIQKMSLLHFMDTIYNEAISKYIDSREIILNYVQFNYVKNFNMNAVKIYLAKLENMNTLFEHEYIIYCIRENLNNFNKSNNRQSIEEEKIKIEELIEFKYKRCKKFFF